MTPHEELFDKAADIAKVGKKFADSFPTDLPVQLPGKTYAQIRGLIRSAFQKDVRRGNVDAALMWGMYLMTNDKAYAWGTLHTIIIEDVGAAAPYLCSIVAMAGLSGFRDRFGAHNLFRGLIAAACIGSKNRSPCELSVYYEAAGYNSQIGDKTDTQLLHMLVPQFDDPVDIARRLQMYHAGVWLRQRSRNGNDLLLNEALNRLMQAYVDVSFTRDVMIVFERPIEAMSQGLHPILFGRGETQITHPAFPEATIIRDKVSGIPNVALDSHTELGRQAIGMFTAHLEPKVKKQFADYPVSKYKLEKLIGKVIFFQEGCLVDLLEQTPTEAKLAATQRLAYYKKTTKDMPLIKAVQQLVLDELDVLREYRQQVLK